MARIEAYHQLRLPPLLLKVRHEGHKASCIWSTLGLRRSALALCSRSFPRFGGSNSPPLARFGSSAIAVQPVLDKLQHIMQHGVLGIVDELACFRVDVLHHD